MFCPKCGNPDQLPETFCRRCGTFLPDLDAPAKKKVSPEEHIKATSYLSLLTAVVSLALAITLYSTLAFKDDTPFIIYLVAGFLIAITAWQIQTFIRSLMLKRQIAELKPKRALIEDPVEKLHPPPNLLEEKDFEPATVTEVTTRNLDKIGR